MRRVLALTFTFLFALGACSDDPIADADTLEPDATEEVAPDAGDTSEADGSDSSDEVEEPVCEVSCLNEYGVNDKGMCPDPKSEWRCVAGCCEAVFRCSDDDACRSQGADEGYCDDDRFDCRCKVDADTVAPEGTGVGECFTWMCIVTDDCDEGLVCSGGNCVEPAAEGSLSLRILNRPSVLQPGAELQLFAELYDPADSTVVQGSTPEWSSSDASVISVDAAGVLKAEASAGLVTITATQGEASASVVFENIVPSTDDITLAIRTELTAEPVTGTYLVIDSDGVQSPGTLPNDGLVVIAAEADKTYEVHIFADENDWVSWLGLEAGDFRYLPIPKTVYSLVKVSQDKEVLTDESELRNVAVMSGYPDFDAMDSEDTLEVAVTSTGLSSALFDFSLPALLGADVNRYIDPEAMLDGLGVSKDEAIELPGGIVLNLIGPAIPEFYLGLPRGTHRVWTLGGRLNINDIAEYSAAIFGAVGGGELDVTEIVGAIFPLFRTFWSGYTDSLEVTDVGPGSNLVAHDQPLTTPMAGQIMVLVPELPALGEVGWADSVFLLAGAQTVDGVMVPLGLAGGSDTTDPEKNPPDGWADGNEKTPEIDPFLVPYAPLHDGLQGPSSRYILAAVAAAIPPNSRDPRPSSGSATLLRWEPGSRPVEALDLPPFLAFPELESLGADLDARLIQVAEVPEADMVRVLLKGKRGEHWTVYGAEGVLSLPDVDSLGLETDRFQADALDSILINAMEFVDGVDADAIGRPGGVDLDMLLDVVQRVIFIDTKNAPLNDD